MEQYTDIEIKHQLNNIKESWNVIMIPSLFDQFIAFFYKLCNFQIKFLYEHVKFNMLYKFIVMLNGLHTF
jgi:hypothetical protein